MKYVSFDSSGQATRLHLVFAIGCLLLTSASRLTSTALAAEPSKRPNVIVILTDDQGWGDLSVHGNPNLKTPNIDSLAKDGARMKHFYVCPVCSPTRAEFLTGRYHPRDGVFGVTRGAERLDPDVSTIADYFRSSGYATAAYGKWHNGMQWPYHPNARGFDDYYGFCSGHWGNYFSPMLEHNGKIVKGSGFLVDDLTDHAIDFIDQHSEQPFFVYLPYNTPHSPMQVPDRFWDSVGDKAAVPDPHPENAKREDADMTRAALAMCENIDWNVGRLLKHLETKNLVDNTIVVYFSDNGPNSYRFNGGMRGRKGMTFEGGVRSPCMVRYPAAVKAGQVCESVCGAVDLLPTLAEFCDVELEPNSPSSSDGHSFASLLTSNADSAFPEDRILVTHWNRKMSARLHDVDKGHFRFHHDGKLYHLDSDPDESDNVSDQFPAIAKKLSDEINRYREWIEPKKKKKKGDERPITIGHPDAIWTQVPARDGRNEDGIERNNRHANCTFFTNWTDTKGRIVWDVDVLAKGSFEVQMYYAVDKKNVGSTIELSVGDSKLSKTIDQANETPLIGQSDDRVKRIEGYVKRWKPITLGKIDLPAGRSTLQLRSTKVAGDEVAQFRLLMFRRLP